MSEPLYVDPERLAHHSRPYEAASQEWVRIQEWVAGIRDRYNGAWGDDDLGNKFGPDFLEGMNSVEGRAEGVAHTLIYYAEGLVESGRVYGDARDDAEDTTRSLLLDTEYLGGYAAPEGAEYFGVRAVEGTALQLRQEAVAQELPPGENQPAGQLPAQPRQFMRATALTMPLMRGQLIEGRHLTQFASRKEAIPGQPATEGEPKLALQRAVLYARVVEPAVPLQQGARLRGRLLNDPALPLEAQEQEAFMSVDPLQQEVFTSVDPREQEAFMSGDARQQEAFMSVDPLEPLQGRRLPAEPVVKTE